MLWLCCVVSALLLQAGANPADARLPLPSPQDLDAIKKVAQILVTLGQQVLGSRYSARVIPGIIGEPVPAPGGCEPAAGADDVPTDPVTLDRQPA
ncbi:hypothetical protein SFRURICE_005263 [Spodoptera frugiperda]|nr:hypothetical protein SFRURICE_005263 [Spodoptera frugiperda]